LLCMGSRARGGWSARQGRGALGSVTVPCFKGRGALGSVREEEQCQNDTV
jgi:hypothetical protein